MAIRISNQKQIKAKQKKFIRSSQQPAKPEDTLCRRGRTVRSEEKRKQKEINARGVRAYGKANQMSS